MNDKARQVLINILNEYGVQICEEPLRCRSLLKDLCPDCPKEIHILMYGLDAKIHSDILNENNHDQQNATQKRLVKRLEDTFAITKEAAVWSVESWFIALNERLIRAVPLPDRPPILDNADAGQLDLFDPPTPPKADSLIHSFSGHGNQTIESLTLNAGLHIFEITHEGVENFYVELRNANTGYFEMLANEVGSLEISKPLGFAKEETLFLAIEADGNWNINVKKLGRRFDKLPKFLTGIGSQSSGILPFSKNTKVAFTHKGNKNFIVSLLETNGDFVDLIINEVGKLNGRKRSIKNHSGDYVFEINADGEWKIAFS